MKEGSMGKNAAANEREEQQKRLTERMGGIRRKIVVLSGKGGVGKSTVAANLAVSLSLAGHKVGLLDADIHGPSIPRIFNLEGQVAGSDGESIMPVPYGENLLVMSIGFLLRDRDEAVIWRGPLKMGVLRQFLADVEWGRLDYLVVDLPPGTGDEPLSICQLIPDADGGIVVTTPQELALVDVRKCINFCRKLDLPVLGVVENMSGFICPHCGKRTDVFGEGGAETMAIEMDVPFLGRVPLDPDVVRSCEADVPYVERFKDTQTAKVFASVARAAAKSDENS
jgi:ATP-binding protein involved in chromosome partitioning